MSSAENRGGFTLSQFNPLEKLRAKGRRVFIRSDLNLPMRDGEIADSTRAKAALPTIRYVIKNGGVAVVASHLGRPGGTAEQGLSLRPIHRWLETALTEKVTFCPHKVGTQTEKAILQADPGEVVLLENLRFDKGEEAADPGYARRLAAGCDAYVGDAFSVAHRGHGSVAILPELLDSYIGKLMASEVAALAALENPKRPSVALCGGKKVSDKLETLVGLARRMDYLLVGGAMANTMLALLGENVGGSVYERRARQAVLAVVRSALADDCRLILPTDGMAAASPTAAAFALPLKRVGTDQHIFDIGPLTVKAYKKHLAKARTILWNGPMGFFEQPPFNRGTEALAAFMAERSRNGECMTVIGGGDTVAACKGIEGFSHVCLGGGAFLSWAGGKPLPGLEALRKAAKGA